MNFKLAQLQAAADDLTVVLKLNPPIVTTMVEIKGRGAAKALAEAEFIARLEEEIRGVAEGQDPENKLYDLRSSDLPVLKPETVEVIFGLSEVAKARLTVTVAEGNGKKKGKGKAAPVKAKVPAADKGKAPAAKEKQTVTRKSAFLNVIGQMTKEMSLKDFNSKVVALLTNAGKSKVGKLEYECKFTLDILTSLGYLTITKTGNYIVVK